MTRRFKELTRMTIRTRTAKRFGALAAAGLSLIAGQALAQQGAFPETGGKEIYEAICQSCHMPDGKGTPGASAAPIGYPALANNPKLTAGAYPAMVVVRGQKAMPSFGATFTDVQVANVVNYIRTQFGNNYTTALTPQQVTPMRPARPVTGEVRPPG